MGMTHEQYWHGNPWLVKPYREAAKLKQQDDNFNYWLQGKYIYDALQLVSPLLRAFSKKPKAIPYHTEPYQFGKKKKEEVVEKEEREMHKMKTLFECMAARINKNMKNKTPPSE